MKSPAHRATKRTSNADVGVVATVLIIQPVDASLVITNAASMSSNSWPDPEIHRRANTLTTILTEMLARADHAQHWGINE
jgi:hypothetical protein